jgi:hypothetical protein
MLIFVRKIKEDPEDYLDSWNLLEELDLAAFVNGIKELDLSRFSTIDEQLKFIKQGRYNVCYAGRGL